MDAQQIESIRRRVMAGRTVYYYFQDRYVLMLLAEAVGEGRSVREIKASPLAPLLNKPAVKQLLARHGSGRLRAADFEAVWHQDLLAYRLTLGCWPLNGEKWIRNWHQMTRRGLNLVLQMNLCKSHVRQLRQLLKIDERDFLYDEHPIAPQGETTLAWSRLDIDLDYREALIEEVQSDWVGMAIHMTRNLSDTEGKSQWEQYIQKILRPHIKLWEEAMLSATITFLREDLGIERIFYHTYESSLQLKHLGSSRPPKSLYTRLPRRFCFQVTHNGPLFLRDKGCRTMRRQLHRPDTKWHLLRFDRSAAATCV